MSETIEPGTALAILPRAQFPVLLAAGEGIDILSRLRAELEGFEGDISTEKGRAEIRSKAQKVRAAKADFERLAKRLKEDAIKTQRGINAELRPLEEEMVALINRVRAPLDEYEAAEKARIKANEDAIAALEALTDGLEDLSAEEIKRRRFGIQPFDWSPEFRIRGERVGNGVIAQLQVAHQTAVQREAEAEAQRQAEAEQAETERKEGHETALNAILAWEHTEADHPTVTAEAMRATLRDFDAWPARHWEEFAAQASVATAKVRESIVEALSVVELREAEERRQREAQIAQEAADAARKEAEAKAERERIEAERLAQAERDAAAERERKAAEELERAEERRVAGHKRRLDAIPENPEWGKTESSRDIERRLSWLRAIRVDDFEEFDDDARAIIQTETERANGFLQDALAHEADQEAERQKAVAERERLVAAEAEKQRIAREEQAERDRIAAVEAERKRVADAAAAQKADDEKRAANRAHRAAINRAVLADLILAMSGVHSGDVEEANKIATAIVTAIAKGNVAHMAINYSAQPVGKEGALI